MFSLRLYRDIIFQIAGMGKEQPLIYQFQVSTPGHLSQLINQFWATAFSKGDPQLAKLGDDLRPTRGAQLFDLPTMPVDNGYFFIHVDSPVADGGSPRVEFLFTWSGAEKKENQIRMKKLN